MPILIYKLAIRIRAFWRPKDNFILNNYVISGRPAQLQPSFDKKKYPFCERKKSMHGLLFWELTLPTVSVQTYMLVLDDSQIFTRQLELEKTKQHIILSWNSLKKTNINYMKKIRTIKMKFKGLLQTSNITTNT